MPDLEMAPTNAQPMKTPRGGPPRDSKRRIIQQVAPNEYGPFPIARMLAHIIVHPDENIWWLFILAPIGLYVLVAMYVLKTSKLTIKQSVVPTDSVFR